MLRALTVQQPWAGAFFVHGKDVENRVWSTKHTGPLVIHAAKRNDVDDPLGLLSKKPNSHLWACGGIIGVVELVKVVRNYDSQWAEDHMYHWVVRNPCPLKAPIPYTGAQSLWTLSDLDVLRAIYKLL